MSNIAFIFIFALWMISLIFLPVCLLSFMEYLSIEFEKELYHDRYGEYF